MKNTIIPFLPSIIYAVLGVFAFITADQALLTICQILGVALVILGLVLAIRYLMKTPAENFSGNGFVSGLVLALLGITLIVKAEILIPLIPYTMGFMIALNGIREMQNAIDVWKLKLAKPWIVSLVAIVNLIFGIVIMINPGMTLAVMMKAVGIGLVISAAADFVTTSVVLGKSRKTADRPMESTIVNIDSED